MKLQGLVKPASLSNSATFPLPFWVDPLGATDAAVIREFNRLTDGPLQFVGGPANNIGEAVTSFLEKIWGDIINNPLVTAGLQSLEQATQVAQDTVEFVTESIEEIVETVAGEILDVLSEAAGWFGF